MAKHKESNWQVSCRKNLLVKPFYVLDEPSTGLHFEDIKLLLSVLNAIVDEGNTVLVIEHNLDIIKVADQIIDIGPEGGAEGGNIVFSGKPKELIKKDEEISYTAKYLKKKCQIEFNELK